MAQEKLELDVRALPFVQRPPGYVPGGAVRERVRQRQIQAQERRKRVNDLVKRRAQALARANARGRLPAKPHPATTLPPATSTIQASGKGDDEEARMRKDRVDYLVTLREKIVAKANARRVQVQK